MNLKEFTDNTKVLEKVENALKKLRLDCNIESITRDRVTLTINLGATKGNPPPKMKEVVGFR